VVNGFVGVFYSFLRFNAVRLGLNVKKPGR